MHSTDTLKPILSSIKDYAIFTLDVKGRVSSWNIGAQNLLGYSEKEILGKDFSIFYTPEKRKNGEAKRRLEDAKLLGKVSEEGYRMRKNGSKFWANGFLTCIQDKKGAILGFTKVMNDVSVRKSHEESLEKYTQELEKITMDLEIKNAKDEALLESIGEGVIATDDEGKLMLMNAAALSMFSLVEGRSKGKLFSDIFWAFDNKGNKIPSADLIVPIVLRTGERVSQLKYSYGAVGKEKFPAAATCSPIKFDDKIIGTVTIFRDIRKEMEIYKAKSEFVSIVSHQLRTPLTAIKLFTEMLINGTFENDIPKRIEMLKNIEESNEKMIYLVNTLLDMSHIEAGKLEIVPVPTQISAFVETVIRESKPLALSKNISFIFRPRHTKQENKKRSSAIRAGRDLDTVEIDRGLFRQVLSNLISNAIEYSKPNSKVWIDISAGEKDGCIISIKDTGIGIPKGSEEKIFERFFRAKNAAKSKASGTGLGLYVCRRIVELHGGRIWVKTKERRGSTFYITISSKINAGNVY